MILWKENNMLDRLYEYIDNTKSGKILVGLQMRQAIERFENDLLNELFYFDEKKAERAVKFIEKLQHYTGRHNNKRFILNGWQIFIVANIFGWYVKETKLRRFTGITYIEVAKKNGKTALAAAISLYCLVLEGEANAKIILAANKTEQAGYCLDAVQQFAYKMDPTGEYLKSYRNQVKFKNNIIKVISSDKKSDGSNTSCCIVDEYHQSTTSDTLESLKSGQIAREQPICMVITTAGFDKKSPCYSLRQTCIEILSGLKKNDSQFIAIFTLDDDDDWQDSKVWEKSNPNLGVTIQITALKNEIVAAKNNISLETGVKTKHLNMWCDTITTWIGDKYVYQASKTLTFDDIGTNEITVGLDLSSNSDLTAVSYMWYSEDKYKFIVKYYLPEDSLNTAIDKEYYKIQHSKGNLTLTAGNVVDYDFILNDILEVNRKHFISKIAYDSWNSTQFAIDATTYGLPLDPYSQGIANFNRPTMEFERMILQNKLVLDNNEITRWMLSNVYLRRDQNGNCKPDKSKANKKIDGVIAMLMSLGEYLITPRFNVSFDII